MVWGTAGKLLPSAVLSVGTFTNPLTDPNTPRPDTTAPVEWIVDIGVVPVNAVAGDSIFTIGATDTALRDRGPLTEGEYYYINDVVSANGNRYRCLTEHEAGAGGVSVDGNAWWEKYAVIDIPVTPPDLEIPCHYDRVGSVWPARPTTTGEQYVHFKSIRSELAPLPPYVDGVDIWSAHPKSFIYDDLEASPDGTVTL